MLSMLGIIQRIHTISSNLDNDGMGAPSIEADLRALWALVESRVLYPAFSKLISRFQDRGGEPIVPRSDIGALRKPLFAEKREMASNILVLPAPFSP